MIVKIENKRIVVTGGAGFIGSSLCEYLVRNNQVVCLDNLSTGFKENIEPYSTEIIKFMELNPVKFTWKESGSPDIGLIAEDVDKLFPEFVSKDLEDCPTGINYSKLSIIFINILKQQQQEIELLKEQIKKLTK